MIKTAQTSLTHLENRVKQLKNFTAHGVSLGACAGDVMTQGQKWALVQRRAVFRRLQRLLRFTLSTFGLGLLGWEGLRATPSIDLMSNLLQEGHGEKYPYELGGPLHNLMMSAEVRCSRFIGR